MKVAVYGLDLGEVPITYKSPTITSSLRTFEIKARLSNTKGNVAPGCMADIEVLLERRQGLGLPEEAVLRRGDKNVVFVVRDGCARMVEVEEGLENDGWVGGPGRRPGTGRSCCHHGADPGGRRRPGQGKRSGRLMFLSNASVKRPVAMSCLIIALFLLGLNSYRKLGLENLPKLDIPYVTVLTVYPGAGPEEIETDVTRKIEDAGRSHRRPQTYLFDLHGKHLPDSP